MPLNFFLCYIIDCSGNIPNGKIEQGEEIVPYLPPFPPKGTGFHRNIFILYKQENKIDFSEYKIKDK